MADSTLDNLPAIAAASVSAADLLYLLTSGGVDKSVRADALLDALALVAAAGGVLSLDASGRLVVRKRGGTAGTQEVRISHDGTNGSVKTQAGSLLVGTPNAALAVADYGSANTMSLTGPTNFYITNSLAGLVLTGYSVIATTGLNTNPGPFTCAVVIGSVVTPAQITADQNNYALTAARFQRLSTDATRTVTGLAFPGVVAGIEFEVWNVGSNNLVLSHQSASSTAANRLVCTGAADLTLAADEIALVRYDSTSSRYRVRKV